MFFFKKKPTSDATKPVDTQTDKQSDAKTKETPKKLVLKSSLGRFFKFSHLDDEVIEELQTELLISDIGLETTDYILQILKDNSNSNTTPDEAKAILAKAISDIFDDNYKAFELGSQKPAVIFMLGVNGSGKTTTIGKMAAQFKAEGKKVLIVAADTFRAAAVEQVSAWAKMANVDIIKPEKDGQDAAALVYNAYEKATAGAYDVLLIDTAGRLQNKQGLMDELGKMFRVIKKHETPQTGSIPTHTLLVLDGNVGQNAHSQLELFNKVAPITGLIMTKLDGSTKGGALIALSHKFKQPIFKIGTGEKIIDLQNFVKDDFIDALLNR